MRSAYTSALSSATTSAAIAPADYVPVTDGKGGIVYQPFTGASISPDYSFSTLNIVKTLSTSSTFTNFISAGQIVTSSIIAQSALIVGSNTLTVYGQSYLSSITYTGSLQFSTIPGQIAPALTAPNISTLEVQTSTVKFVDTTNATATSLLYVTGGVLNFDGTPIGSVATVNSNIGFSNLRVLDTLSTMSTYTEFLSAPTIMASTILFDDRVVITANDTRVAIGSGAGTTGQDNGSIAIGSQAGNLSQKVFAVAIGGTAGYTGQGDNAVAIGTNAGNVDQGNNSVAIGLNAGNTSQGVNCIAIGNDAGNDTQLDSAIAIGYLAGKTSQKLYSVAIGNAAGQQNQATQSIAIGLNAGTSGQTANSVAIGTNAGSTTQGQNAVAIGRNAALYTQGNQAIAVGYGAGSNQQGAQSVALGTGAGSNLQGANSLAFGTLAGRVSQGNNSVAIGNQAGCNTQFSNSVAIGNEAGRQNQYEYSVAIGNQAGRFYQGPYATAIGYQAGCNAQGDYSIAIGYKAGYDAQETRTIILNATGEALNGVGAQERSFYVKPIRNATGLNSLFYDVDSGEITYDTGGGGSVASNFGFSNLGILNHFSTPSISTLNISAPQLMTSSITFSDSIILRPVSENPIRIGYNSGVSLTSPGIIAIGHNTAVNVTNSDNYNIAIGYHAGETILPDANGVAIGFYAGQTDQNGSVAIGNEAGKTNQGLKAIAIGSEAGKTNQNNYSIIINASNGELNSLQNNSFYVAPIRYDNTPTLSTLAYNPYTKEITYGDAGSISTLNISTNAIQAQYISTYSMTVFGPNTLTVQGNTVMSTIIISGQISTVGTAPFATDLTLESLTLQDPDTQATQTMYTSSIVAGQTVVQQYVFVEPSGNIQTFTVPAGVTSITAQVWGAGGTSDQNNIATGGNGAYVEGGFSVTPGEDLILIVAQQGVLSQSSYGGGGGRGGGGASWIKRSDVDETILILAAGGGAASYGEDFQYNGGSAGTTSVAGSDGQGGDIAGKGATSIANGQGGANGGAAGVSILGSSDPALPYGGQTASGNGDGGGGAGKNSGGGGGFDNNANYGGGGGGVSYKDATVTLLDEIAGGDAGSSPFDSIPNYVAGIGLGGVGGGRASGNGLIVLTYTLPPTPAIFSDRQYISSLTNEYFSSLSGVMGPLDVSDPTKFKITTLNPYTPGQSNLYYDDVSKQVYYGPPGGGSIDSNYAFSNLRIADTLSTMSTFTEYLSAPTIYTSSIYMNQVRIEMPAVSQIAIGNTFGALTAPATIAIGNGAGPGQGNASIAIGNAAGVGQGDACIAIGDNANYLPSSGTNNTIVIGTGIKATGSGQVHIGPMRADPTANLSTLTYNPLTKEITYSPFRIESGNISGLNFTGGQATVSFLSQFNTAPIVMLTFSSAPDEVATLWTTGVNTTGFNANQQKFSGDLTAPTSPPYIAPSKYDVSWIAYGQ